MSIAMLAFTGAATALGVGYFAADLYRNRSKRLLNFEPIADMTGLECSPNALQLENEIAHQTVHSVVEVSHRAGDGLGRCVEAIAHTLSHH